MLKCVEWIAREAWIVACAQASVYRAHVLLVGHRAISKVIRGHTQTVAEMELQPTSASPELARGKLAAVATTRVDNLKKESAPQQQRRKECGATLQRFLRMIGQSHAPGNSGSISLFHPLARRVNLDFSFVLAQRREVTDFAGSRSRIPYRLFYGISQPASLSGELLRIRPPPYSPSHRDNPSR